MANGWDVGRTDRSRHDQWTQAEAIRLARDHAGDRHGMSGDRGLMVHRDGVDAGANIVVQGEGARHS